MGLNLSVALLTGWRRTIIVANYQVPQAGEPATIIGPDIHAAAIALVSYEPKQPAHYKDLIPKELGIVHVTVEAHPCTWGPIGAPAGPGDPAY